jgi:hypothetical protein
MATLHDPINVISGVPWTIAGTLYDAAGNLLDVTNCTLSWYLLDANGNPVPTPTATITKTDPINGAIQISIDKSDTMLDPSRYTDALQVVAGTNKDVFWTGQIPSPPIRSTSELVVGPRAVGVLIFSLYLLLLLNTAD